MIVIIQRQMTLLRSVTLGIVVLLFGTKLKAQEYKISLDLDGGPGIAIMAPTRIYLPRVNAAAGIGAEYRFTPTVSLKVNVLYERKGGKRIMSGSLPGGFPDGTSYYNYDYIDLPVMVRFRLSDRFFINPGIYYGRLIEGHTDFYADDSDLEISYYYNGFPKNDFGLCFGVGYAASLNRKYGLSAEIRGSAGGVNLNNGGTAVTTNSVVLLFGFQYRLINGS